MTTPAEQAAIDHFEKIKSPTALAQTCAMQMMGKPYIVYPWVAYIESEIINMLARPGREVLLVSVPPQEGKSTFSCYWFVNWYLGNFPDNLLILVTYNDEYAGTWGMKCRTFFEQLGRQMFNVGLHRSMQSINNWRTTRGFGGMLSAGINGGITGNPGHVIVIDDVIKTMEEAGSPTTKRKHLEEWDGSISSRFQENTKVIITSTRWAEDDLSGEVWARAQEEGYEGIPITRINIRARAEPDQEERALLTPLNEGEWRDFLGRKTGDYLRGQHSPHFFHEKEHSISPYVWSSLYQGDPTARKGSMFPRDNWGWYDPDDRPRMIIQRRVWDIAATEGGGDNTVGTLAGKDVDGFFYVLDVRKFQKNANGVKEEVKRIADLDGRHVPIRMEMERAGAGKTTIAFYENDLPGFDFDGVRAEGEKISRFFPYSDLQIAGRVKLPRRKDGTSPEWVEPFIFEHQQQMPPPKKGKPRGPKNDDQIDTMSYAVAELGNAGPAEVRDPNENEMNVEGIDVIDELADLYGLTISSGSPRFR